MALYWTVLRKAEVPSASISIDRLFQISILDRLLPQVGDITVPSFEHHPHDRGLGGRKQGSAAPGGWQVGMDMEYGDGDVRWLWVILDLSSTPLRASQEGLGA
jgi:hypothetical protein